jgi:phage shock protein C
MFVEYQPRRKNMETPSKKLYRSRSNRIIAGVCAGLGEFFAIDPTVVRLIFVLGMIFGFGSFAFAYLVMIFVVPEEPAAGV